MTLIATAALLFGVGAGYLFLLGTAVSLVALPRRWLPLAPLVTPFLGWAALVAVGYPLNAVLPFRTVAILLGVVAGLAVALGAWRGRLRCSRRSLREAVPPWLLGLATYLVAVVVHVRQGALTALVVDSDVEHFPDVVSGLLHYPIGPQVVAQQGLEATPVGLAYHYVHAALSALGGGDAFGTALPAHFLMLALGVSAVYVFARSFMGLGPGGALLATVLYAGGALPLVVASFGWGQQTAALATVPVALAALRLGVSGRDARSLWAAGLLGALAAGSLYLATAPLVGGAALAMAVVAGVRGRSTRPLWRLLGVGAIVVSAGLLSHLSAGAFLLERSAAGLLRADELSGRSTHVSGFASPEGLAGVAPLELYRDVSALDGSRLLQWPAGAAGVAVVATVGAVVLVLAGALGSKRARPYLGAFLGVVLLYEGYLRLLRPFPYGEFKLLSTVWFLVPVLAVSGWTALAARPRPQRLASLALAAYALGIGITWGHTVRFLSLPWGAVLPEAAMQDARRVAEAVQPGASVYVSGQLVPPVSLPVEGNAGLTLHRAGFASAPARAGYLVRRWRGAVTGLLAFGGHPVYGLVQRHSTELRAPVAPNATDYLLLDALEDSRYYGMLPEDLALSAGTLRLYRQAGRPWLSLPDLPQKGTLTLDVSTGALSVVGARKAGLNAAAVRGAGGAGGSGAALPVPELPIGESLPGRRQGMAPPLRGAESGGSRVAPAPASSGQVLIGFHAVETAALRVVLRGAGERSDGAGERGESGEQGVRGESVARDLVLTPGLTWYATPAAPFPAQLEVLLPDGREGVRAVAATVLTGSAVGPEALERSAVGTAWPLLSLAIRPGQEGGAGPDQGIEDEGDEDQGITLEAWYSYLGPREGSAQARLRDATELWIGGQSTPTSLHLGPGGRTWRVTLTPGERPRQETSDGRPAPDSPTWERGSGRRWVWLEVGPERGASLHDPPLAAFDLEGGRARLVAAGAPAVVLPLLAERPPPAPASVAEGTLVKGSADDLFYVEGGKLRWVRGMEVLERHRIPWRLSVIDDHALWRMPVGLPLT